MIAHLDCQAGAAGDMVLGALLGAGADLGYVRDQLSRVAAGLEISVTAVHRCGIRATRVEVRGGEGPAAVSGAAVVALVGGAGLDGAVAERALAVLRRLVAAEAAVHGVSPDEVHLHELGSADTLVDAVGTAAALASLAVERLSASPVATGWGTAGSAHGSLPLPAPAVVELLKGAPLYGVDLEAELVTPTGAAILAALAESFGPLPPMRVRAAGYGAGARELAIPNVVRCILGEPVAPGEPGTDEVMIEATIDDMSPELYPYVMERLAAAGADDAWLVAAVGKRGRPAQVLQVLVPPHAEATVREVLFAETSTIGVRAHSVRRWMLPREWVEVEVAGRRVRVKVARREGRIAHVAPEYADCAEAARATGLPLKEVYERARSFFIQERAKNE